MSRIILILELFFVCITLSTAQIGHGGRPSIMGAEIMMHDKSFGNISDQPQTVISFTPPTNEYIKTELRANKKGRPLRFAYPNFVDLSPENSGMISVLDDGRLYWQLRLTSVGAYSLNVIFDRFHLNQGDSLFIYNPSGSYVIGALTEKNNKSWGGLATAPVPGDEVIIEWKGKKLGEGGAQLKIGAVNHDFLGIINVLASKVGQFGDSGPCHTDFTCYDDSTWLLNGRSVCQVIVNGTEYCSGTLMNNSLGDGTPYVLTAGHCLGTNLSPESVVFIFNYEVPQCQTFIDGSKIQSISGASLRAYADQLDFALLEMSEYPPEYFRVYYSGWDLTTTPQGGVHTVHHPYGDVKKVAVSSESPEEASYFATSRLGNTFLEDAHWKVAQWTDGTTEPGSSGAGLFLGNGAFIGLLSGGSATCSNPVNDYFIRLNKIWDYLPEDTARVDLWLNPSGEDISFLPGLNPSEGNLMRVSHFPEDGIPELKKINGANEYWTGPNSLMITDVAEKYDEFSSGKIYGLFLVPGASYYAGDGNIDIKIWSGTDKPQTLLASKNNVKIGAESNKELLILFDEPVSFSENFFAGYTIDYSTPIDTFAVYQVATTERDNSLFLNSLNSGWQSYSSLSGDFPSMAWIDVLVGYVNYTDSSHIDIPEQFYISPNPAGKYTNIYYPENGTGQISIYNLKGNLVLTKQVTINDNYYELRFFDRLVTGVYLLQLKINGKALVKKLVVQK
ncbi:T9SS type A sorting domain-containing protein [Thermophagus xiamenensis]|uniref:Por secretion system C-terminal sorting domain-containing protein n=1 Tax=Thermophagus xiamenensis TaxID=385682 RepID=A0A1I2AZT4_9BACT|nr:T9SS type A sorting domain-containing protein [Thermophagus xiamenensis]SFE49432.1 Por secretion system C-terminal sorting domain-containing protein [Thermophagus xiamenensis]